jgi:uncharacterized coiled-coil protein SlyX
MMQPATKVITSQQTRGALLARRARTEASLAGVREIVDRMLKDKTPITMAAVARQAGVSRTFLYDNPEARQIIATATAKAAGRRAKGHEAEREALKASWRERALNSEDALKAAHAEILRQREQIAELLGQIRDLNTGWTEDDRIRMTTENLALKRATRDQETEIRSLTDKLAAARENNRFADRRIADLEARIAEPQLGQGNDAGQHSANGKP